MPLIPADLLATIKREKSCAAVLEARGYQLEKRGKDLVCCCPFHDEQTPSFIVTPDKNLWHCLGACQEGGDVIKLVMKLEGCSFREAVERLHGGPLPETEPAAAISLAAGCPLDPELDDAALAGQVIDYYHSRLTTASAAWEYLASRGLARRDVIDHFRLGVADRSLGQAIPSKQVKLGATLRGRLEVLGYFRPESGHEHFNGSVVVPIFDERGQVVECYGRKITRNLRKGTPDHLYLPGPHRGVFNRPGLAAGGGVVVLCEALIDALTLWANGIQYVTASFGTGGFTADHRAALQAANSHTVVIAYDADPAGDNAAEKLAHELLADGYAVKRALLPPGMDINAVAVEAGPEHAPALLRGLVEHAQLWGAPVAPAAPVASAAAELLVADLDATPAPSADAAAPRLQETAQGDLELMCGPRRWRVRGAAAKPGATLRVNLRVLQGDAAHVDSVDLMQARARAAFVQAAESELGVKAAVLKSELARLLRAVEAWQDAQAAAAAAAAASAAGRGASDPAAGLSEPEREAALQFLQSPDLLARILGDLDAMGVVGEAAYKLTVYLAATSRLLDKPLGVLVQSSSSAGKSTVVDRVLDLMPEAQTHRYASMSENALVYEQRDIRHHILAIAELEGAGDALYALKLLQSDGQLSRATVSKQADTGTVAARELTVQGPVALFVTTTDKEVDPELQNRCLTLTISEDANQTAAIHDQQRLARTVDGLRARAARVALVQQHRHAQSLLRSLVVLNPYAPNLRFRVDRVRMRRDHEKYLALIDAVALLHQHQREILTIDIAGAPLACIEATLDDVAIAGELMDHLLGRSLDDLPPQSRRLLGLIAAWQRRERPGNEAAHFTFSRRELLRETAWSYRQVQVHLDRLVEQDYVVQHGSGRGGRLLYELVDDGAADADGLRCPGLIDVAALAAQMGEPVPTTKVLPVEKASLTPGLPGVDRSAMSNFEPIKSTVSGAESQSSTRKPAGGPGPQKTSAQSYTQMEAARLNGHRHARA